MGLAMNFQDLKERYLEEQVRGRDTGYVPYQMGKFRTAVRRARSFQAIPISGSFLDLGSGTGDLVAVMSDLGYIAHGIELNSELVRVSREILESLRTPATIHHGSYFPHSYMEMRRRGIAKALPFEQAMCGEDSHKHFHPVQSEFDPEELIADVDIFACHPWAEQVPSVYEIFQRYGKKDAVLLLCCAQRVGEDKRMLSELEVRIENIPGGHPMFEEVRIVRKC